MKIFLILPMHLFENNKYLQQMDKIYIIEDFSNYQHKQKLMLHRASMKYYYDKISKNNKNVIYIDYSNINYDKICMGCDIYLFDPIDKPIIKKLSK